MNGVMTIEKNISITIPGASPKKVIGSVALLPSSNPGNLLKGYRRSIRKIRWSISSQAQLNNTLYPTIGPWIRFGLFKANKLFSNSDRNLFANTPYDSSCLVYRELMSDPLIVLSDGEYSNSQAEVTILEPQDPLIWAIQGIKMDQDNVDLIVTLDGIFQFDYEVI